MPEVNNKKKGQQITTTKQTKQTKKTKQKKQQKKQP